MSLTSMPKKGLLISLLVLMSTNLVTASGGAAEARGRHLINGPVRAQAAHLAADTVAGDEHWLPGFILNGGAGVYVLATDGTNLYAGGGFSMIGGVIANRIAMWNASTNRWSALASGMDNTIWALAVDRGGNLYAGGIFTTAGGVAANHIARWDGSSWSALGSGLDGVVYTLTVDNQGNVYAGGSISTAGGAPASNIAEWSVSTNSWSALGSGTSGEVDGLAVDGNGNVFAGGSFTAAGGLSANCIAKWDGATWKALGAGISAGSSVGSMVFTLALDNDGNLYAGGDFTLAGTASVNNIAKWDGTNWSALGGGLIGGTYRTSPRALVMNNGNLYVAGDFSMAGGISANHVAKWNGNNWEAFSSGTNDLVNGLAIDHSGNVYVSGGFTVAGDVPANNIARWTGENWSILGIDNSINSSAYALAVDKRNTVYSGGGFTAAGGHFVNRIARWNGMDWSALGEGISGGSVSWICNGSPCVLALSTDGQDNLYAGGTFTMSGEINTNHIAKWDGSGWSALGTGLNGYVNAVATDEPGNVFAGGSFTLAGGTTVNNIARWNVSTNTWEALGAGLDGSVSALAVAGNGSLYAGGLFTNAGELSVNHVAMWNGSVWSALGAGICCGITNKSGYDLTEVAALALDRIGNLYAAGNFTKADDVSAAHVAMWNGSNWQALGSGITGGSSVYGPFVNAVALDPNDNLIVGGDITAAGGIPVQGLARWNGNSWSALGSGISGCYYIWGCVLAIAADSNGNIYAVGEFNAAGGKPSVHFAEWIPHLMQIYFPWVVR